MDVGCLISISFRNWCYWTLMDASGCTFYMVRFNSSTVTLDCRSLIDRGRGGWRCLMKRYADRPFCPNFSNGPVHEGDGVVGYQAHSLGGYDRE